MDGMEISWHRQPLHQVNNLFPLAPPTLLGIEAQSEFQFKIDRFTGGHRVWQVDDQVSCCGPGEVVWQVGELVGFLGGFLDFH